MFRLKQDSRDLHYHQKFGTVDSLPDEFILDTPLPDAIQPVGNNKCTAFTICDMAADQDGIIYDIDEFFARIPGANDAIGADLRKAMSEAVEHGLKPKNGGLTLKHWSSYWRADTGPKDAFDNTRSAMYMAKLPVGAGTVWYEEWTDGHRIVTFGSNVVSSHAWAIEGWTIKDNQPMLQVEAHIGYKLYFPRDVYNYVIGGYGAGAFVLSTATVDLIRKRNILELLVDAYRTLLALLHRDNVITVPTPPPLPSLPITERDLVNEFCLAIQQYEGWYPGSTAYRNNNPGNIRSVAGGFLVFKTYNEGFAYLKDYVTRACTGKHKAYQPTYSITQFFQTYSPTADSNNPEKYAQWVADKLKLPVTTQIKNLV